MTRSQGLFRSSQQQKKPFQTIKANTTDFHSHYVKRFISIRRHQSLLSFCREQPTSKPKSKRPEQPNFEREQKETRKSSEDFNPITAFKQQGTLIITLFQCLSPQPTASDGSSKKVLWPSQGSWRTAQQWGWEVG